MTVPANRKRHALIAFAKIALAAAILGYLILQIQRQSGFARLIHEPKHWHLLTIGLACTLVSITLSFVRWHVLLAALDLNFRLVESMRLGALGFALNFVSLGAIGGDLFKAIFAAKGSPGRRTEAVATVVADRLVGVLIMMTLATAATFMIDRSAAPPAIRALVKAIRIGTLVLWSISVLVLLMPGLTGVRLQSWLHHVPLVGSTISRLIATASAYRGQTRHLAAACFISIFSNTFFILSFYFVARGLPVRAPNLAQHFVIVPVANLAGAIPATPSGLGTMEAAVDALYQAVPAQTEVPAGDGTLVALGQRFTMILVAAVCLAFYVLQRGDLREAILEIEEVEAEAEAEAEADVAPA